MTPADRMALLHSQAALSEIRAMSAADESLDLSQVRAALQRLATSPLWNEVSWPEAAPGQERLHELAAAPGVASLYLVSDGAGVVSQPHGHGTWVVIAGIRGQEVNVLYREGPDRSAVPVRRVIVGPGEVLALSSTEIHSTEVLGAAPTYHLHLYGRPLRELARFETRVFVPQRGGSDAERS